MQEVTITQISPAELETLIENSLKRMFADFFPAKQPSSDCWFNLKELIEYLPDKPSKATIYAYVSAKTIPCHKSTKKLRFLKAEIDAWLQTGKKKTSSEIQSETDEFLQNLRQTKKSKQN